MNSVMITGGAGFIGSHLAEALASDHQPVVIVDNLDEFYDPQLKLENLQNVTRYPDVLFMKADIRDRAAIRRSLEAIRPTAVVHLAASAGVRPSVERPDEYVENNVGGTANVLEAARRSGVETFIFASSSSVYGERTSGPFAEGDVVSKPASPYAATKLAGEQLCFTYSSLFGMRITCLRFFTVYGPRQRPDLAIRKFYERLRRGETIELFGDGETGRDYTYISDIVAGLRASLSLKPAFEIINLGNSRPILLKELVAALAQLLEVQPRLQYLPPQPGDVGLTFADISKAVSLLGYSPSVSLNEGLRLFHRWCQQRLCVSS